MCRCALPDPHSSNSCGDCEERALGDPPPRRLAPPPPRRRAAEAPPGRDRVPLSPALQELIHPTIVNLKDAAMGNHEPFFIFENMECNLYDARRESQVAFPEGDIWSFMVQILQGLAYMHNNGYFHRDLKPENLLVTNGIVKIAGFGLAREVSSNPPYTDCVSTRWYRHPEVLLQSLAYTPAMDMRMVGAILAEHFTQSPLFPGPSETNQLYKIRTVLGTPDRTIGPEGMNITRSCSFKFFQIPARKLWELIPNALLEAIDSTQQLCSWDPRRRPTAEQASEQPLFNVCKPRPVHDASHTKTNEPNHTNHVPRLTEEEILLYSGFENAPVNSGSNPSSSWSDLPKDLVLSILLRLQLPEAIAFASVCTSWRSAATAAGVPCSCTPMIMSWRDILNSREARGAKGSSSVNCKFLHLLDVHKAHDVRFPQGLHFVACCGSSHGWLILVNELANLVLYNPFTSEMIPLPPITDFKCIEAVRGSEGNIEAYNFENHEVQDAKYLATWFYQKAVLSCSPSKSANYVVMIIHRDNNWLSFVRAGESKWQVAATLVAWEADRYADCAYHNGMFYTVTFHGVVEKWDLDGLNGPGKEVIVAKRSGTRTLTRHLVSTPWGDLLEVRAFVANSRRMYKNGVGFRIFKVDPDGYEKVSPVPKIDLMEHAIFVGLNHSTCLSTKNFPRLRPCCIYFSVPWMTPIYHLLRRCPEWEGVKTYDLEQRTFDHVFPLCPLKDHVNLDPSEVWITPNL